MYTRALRDVVIVAALAVASLGVSTPRTLGAPRAQVGPVLRIGPFCPHGLRPREPDAPARVAAAVRHDAHHFLINGGERPYQIVQLISLQPGVDPWADTMYYKLGNVCGARVMARSWAVVIYFPYWGKVNKSAALTTTFLFVARTTSGWHVWYRTE